ncbi:hypothetical protein GOB94_01090 [Granulicella sp. 5B5]|uniref:DUF6982 domain-containing protein n=1 Tax=Granulicella sp. 5B5 TaxID=1617967 RepID=UPI0015F3628A|nr:hypothetical protein [Granulicella sp. 5B5]QMV17460.1 hypothetical protein GOB94_01090 [Granulicella sp. 5B5]
MAAAQKKVVIRQVGGRLAWGYLPQSGFVHGGQVELIEVDARAKLLDLNEIETIAYVRDFNLDDPLEPERMGRRSFPARPRGEGLWVRVTFRETMPLEGLVSFDMGFIDRLLEDQGVFLVPPDGRGNTLRVFVPRAALKGLEVLGWVTSPTKKLAAKVAREALQAGLFGDE